MLDHDSVEGYGVNGDLTSGIQQEKSTLGPRATSGSAIKYE